MEIEDTIDRISDLPDEILHHIMSFLDSKNATRTCILSKRWNYIRNSSPIFDFCWKSHGSTNYLEKFRNFINGLESSFKRVTPLNLRLQRFSILINLYGDVDNDDDTRLDSVVNQWTEYAMENGVQHLRLVFERSRSNLYVLPETTFVRSAKSIEYYSTKCRSRFYSLEKLILKKVHISEKIIHDITRNCPQLHYLSLRDCCGLKNLQISNLDKLDFLEVDMPIQSIPKLKRVDIDAPNLRKFSFRRIFSTNSINLTSCHNLKELSLFECEITDDWFHLNNDNLLRFHVLESLTISSCHRLRRVSFFTPRLTSFSLNECVNIERIEIDAPALSSFQLFVHKLPVLIAKNVPCQLNIRYRSETILQRMDATWFLQLREFLGTLTQTKVLDIQTFYETEISFDFRELEEAAIPPTPEVEHVILDFVSSPKILNHVDSLIEGLLWSCHPKIISVDSFISPHKEKITQLFVEKLFLNKLENHKCCNACHIKCWRHDLKGAKIVLVEGSEPEELLDPKHVLDTLSLPRAGVYGAWYHSNLRYKLEWDQLIMSGRW